jgi:hypothetical protein
MLFCNKFTLEPMAQITVVFIIEHLDEKHSSGLFGPLVYKDDFNV